MAEVYDGKLNATEVQSLLQNIASVLRHYSVSELNSLLQTAVNKKGASHDSEEYILTLVCEAHNISRKNLIDSKSNQAVTVPRQVAYCLLHYTLGLSTRHIAKNIFHFSYHSTVHDAVKKYKQLDPNIKPDKELIDSIEALKEKVLEKMNNDTTAEKNETITHKKD